MATVRTFSRKPVAIHALSGDCDSDRMGEN
jgi:hypothetical protein